MEGTIDIAKVRVFDRESYNGLHIGINPTEGLTICAYPDGVIRLADCKGCVSEPLTLFEAVREVMMVLTEGGSKC